tara:strand:+ start:223196 stop:223477 length:282 start_codon:yes stop_codon:yes gene_type:complete
MSLKGKYIKGGELCWLHFNTTLGQTQSGDYAYQKAYAKNRSEKIEDGETYVKIIITDVVWKYDEVYFNFKTVNKDGTTCYSNQVHDPERLTLI